MICIVPIYCENIVLTPSHKTRIFLFDQSVPNQIYIIHRCNVLLKKSASQIFKFYYNLKEEIQRKKIKAKLGNKGMCRRLAYGQQTKHNKLELSFSRCPCKWRTLHGQICCQLQHLFFGSFLSFSQILVFAFDCMA